MAAAGRNEKPADFREIARVRFEMLLSCALVASVEPYQIHTAARGPHWIAWLTRDNDAKPDRGVLLVAASRDEAESCARDWIARLSTMAPLSPPR